MVIAEGVNGAGKHESRTFNESFFCFGIGEAWCTLKDDI